MTKPQLHFYVPGEVASLEFADLPQSNELSQAIKRLRIECLGDLGHISVSDIRRATKAAPALTLELGCLIRRARRGEFRRLYPDPDEESRLRYMWRRLPEETPGEQIKIPRERTAFPLVLCEMSTRLRKVLRSLGMKQAGDLTGKKYRDFLRARGMGKKTLQELRELVRQIQEGKTVAPRLTPEQELWKIPGFNVPEALREVIPYDLPISARLDGVLKRMGIARLGDLHGVELSEMRRLTGCGPKTLREALRLLEPKSFGQSAAVVRGQ